MTDQPIARRRNLPDATAADYAHAGGRALVSLIPLVGGPALEVLSVAIADPVSKRRDEWFRSLAAELDTLMDRVDGLDAQALGQNEAFVSTAVQATQAALRTHQQEKLVSLRNAVLNAALPGSPDEDRQHLFISYVDTLTVAHLRLLAFFSDPVKHFQRRNLPLPSISSGNLAHIFNIAYPETTDQLPLYNQFARELLARGLFPHDALTSGMSGTALLKPQITELGREFIRFIMPPAEAGPPTSVG